MYFIDTGSTVSIFYDYGFNMTKALSWIFAIEMMSINSFYAFSSHVHNKWKLSRSQVVVLRLSIIISVLNGVLVCCEWYKSKVR